MEKVFCELCKKEIKTNFTWVDCAYFEYHPKDECGGCDYPVGNSCLKRIPKEFHNSKMSVDEWNAQLGKHDKEGE